MWKLNVSLNYWDVKSMLCEYYENIASMTIPTELEWRQEINEEEDEEEEEEEGGGGGGGNREKENKNKKRRIGRRRPERGRKNK